MGTGEKSLLVSVEEGKRIPIVGSLSKIPLNARSSVNILEDKGLVVQHFSFRVATVEQRLSITLLWCVCVREHIPSATASNGYVVGEHFSALPDDPINNLIAGVQHIPE